MEKRKQFQNFKKSALKSSYLKIVLTPIQMFRKGNLVLKTLFKELKCA